MILLDARVTNLLLLRSHARVKQPASPVGGYVILVPTKIHFASSIITECTYS